MRPERREEELAWRGRVSFLKEVGDPVTGEPIGKSERNLKSAVAGETYEYTQMYPGYGLPIEE